MAVAAALTAMGSSAWVEQRHGEQVARLLDERRALLAADARRVGDMVTDRLLEVYGGLRTIARLPSVRGSPADLSVESRAAVQELYDNLSERVALSEIYLVPPDLDPDAGGTPWLTFDEPRVGLLAGRTPKALEASETHEYRAMRAQLAWLREHAPRQPDAALLAYPLRISEPLPTCQIGPGGAAGEVGLVLSVPLYGTDGALAGLVSGIVLVPVVRGWLDDAGTFALVRREPSWVVHAQGPWDAHVAALVEGRAAEGLPLSAAASLALPSGAGDWAVWGGVPMDVVAASPVRRGIERERVLLLLTAWGGSGTLAGVAIVALRERRRRRKVEDQLRRQEALLSLLHAIPEPLVVVQAARLVFTNAPLADLLGVGLLGRELSSITHPDDRDAILARLDARGPTLLTVRLLRPDGAPLRAEVSSYPILWEEGPAFLLIVRDLQRREALAARAREDDRLLTVGTLAAGLAHELNTPIQYVGDSVAFLEQAARDLLVLVHTWRGLLAGTPAEARAAEQEENADVAYLEQAVPGAASRAREGLGRASATVRALRDFSEAGDTEWTPADLGHLVETSLVLAGSEIDPVADVVRELEPVPAVRCDARAVSQVVLHLVLNAAQAIQDRHRQGGPRGTITVRTRRDGDMACVVVGDTGTGIPLAVRERVFDPYFTTKEVGRGSGQGLAVARAVASRHGGKVWFETEENVGTTFTFALPLSTGPGLFGQA